ncbi:uncharacterized protein LOC106657597 [Trichogramma pretiosum]|uniref:uncharacterized protein LOC106657597 n=1 Tax=Trichogramma pretiosum TaxID=7493 RepID=UPI0006C98A3F|nr:uncharacterized protein LOC106657597 [Trichogramma pretiosum]
MIEHASTGAPSDIKSSFRFYDQMLFLSDHRENIIVNNSSISNESTSSPYLSLDFTLNGDSNSSLDATKESTNEKSPIEIKKRKQECNMELHRELLDILKQQVISQPKELDESGAFAKFVEECLRKLPYRKQKQLQRTIFDAMSKAEDECFEE